MPKTKLPYDFIAGTDDPNEPGFVPCEVASEPLAAECAALGDHLARFVDAEHARTGRDTRCETCAFRRGTQANTTLNVANALKHTMEGTPFYCHETDRPCGGWVQLQEGKTDG